MKKLAMTTALIAASVVSVGASRPAEPVGAPSKEHIVKMVLEDGKYRFQPSVLTAKRGDRVTFEMASGGPHNVAFGGDIPEAAKAKIASALTKPMQPLAGPLLTDAGAKYMIPLNDIPAGTYDFYCMPHMSAGMTGKLTIE
jgi:plastocyanin